MALTNAQVRAVLLVDQSLSELREAWDSRATSRDVYSRAGHLRTLLSQGALSRAWGLVRPDGDQHRPAVIAPDLTILLRALGHETSEVGFAQSAGLGMRNAKQYLPNVHLWMPVALRGDSAATEGTHLPAEQTGSSAEASTTETPGLEQVVVGMPGCQVSGLMEQADLLASGSCYRSYSIPAFLASPAIVHMGRVFSRKAVINAFANKLGSAHIQWDDAEAEYQMLTEPGNWLRISGRTPAVFEVLTIGQVLVLSESVRRFQARVVDMGLEQLL